MDNKHRFLNEMYYLEREVRTRETVDRSNLYYSSAILDDGEGCESLLGAACLTGMYAIDHDCRRYGTINSALTARYFVSL